MSATNRGGKREQNDFYPTPSWLVQALVPHLGRPRRILEPAAGDGAIVKALEEAFPDAEIQFGDIVTGEDFLTYSWSRGYYDLIITNPPYSLAEEFAQEALELVKPGGIVVMLARVSFVCSQRRGKWLRATHPSLYVTPRRPSFVRGNSDNSEYAWFVWDGKPSTVVWLNTEKTNESRQHSACDDEDRAIRYEKALKVVTLREEKSTAKRYSQDR